MLNASRSMRKFATWLAASAVAAGVASCVPPETSEETTPSKEVKPPPSQDLVFEDLAEIQLQGTRFVPDGFGMPRMARWPIKKALPLDRQRKKLAAAKADKKATEGKILVTQLWDEAKKNADEGNQEASQALREETRTVLRDLQSSLGEGMDAGLLQMLFVAELTFNDSEAAAVAGRDMMQRFPEEKITQLMGPWIVLEHLKTWKTTEAAELVQGWNLEAEGMNYRHGYVVGWVNFRRRDYDAARDAFLWAARNWKSNLTRDVIQTDLSLILARGRTPVEQAVAVVTELTADSKSNQYHALYRLHEDYAKVGYFTQAATALEATAAAVGDEIPPADLVRFLYKQAEYHFYKPSAAAEFLTKAYQATEPCGENCAALVGPMAERLVTFATQFHTTYTYTLDESYYGPAKTLYEFYLGLGRDDTETMRTNLTNLEETKTRAQVANGKHTKELMDRDTGQRSQVVLGCYESVLQSEPELRGSIKLMLDIDPSGTVTGATTEPAAGEEGLSAVASCLETEARSWKFPARSLKGLTRVIRSFGLEPKPAEQPAAQPAQS